MKDAFGRKIKPNDIIVYGTRSGSSQDLNFARVTEVVKKKRKWSDDEYEFVRAVCFAGTEHRFTNGKWTRKTQKHELYTGRNVTIRVSHTMVIVNGIDPEAMSGCLVSRQQKVIEAVKGKR